MAAAALLLSGCAPVQPQPAPRAAPRIVSLNPCTDAILAEVADPTQIAALSAYSGDPASSSMDVALARRFAATSGTVEEVLALRPDVVVTGNFTPPATRAAITGLGMRLEEVPIAVSVAESKAQVRRIAMLAGHPERGEALARRIDAALAEAAPPPGPPILTVVWQSGGIVPGPRTLIAELLGRTGFRHAAAERGMKQADFLPLETMLADPPALILAAGHLHAEEDRLLAHPALAALKHTRREPLDPGLLWCGGPTIIRAAERLRAIRAGLGSGASTGSARAEFVPAPLRLSLSKPRRNLPPASRIRGGGA